MTRPTAEASQKHAYDRVARAGHWLVAALAAVVVSVAWGLEGTPRNTPERDLLLLLHRSFGLVILVTMLFRAAWQWNHPAPALPPHVAAVERGVARATHLILYLLFIVMPAAGLINAAAAGHPVGFFGLFSIPPLIPENDRLSQAAIAVHLIGQYLIYLFVALHVAGALLHGLVRRDGVLERMLPRRRAG